MYIFLSCVTFIILMLSLSARAEEVSISEFELKRRISLGDKRAENLLLKKQWAPGLNFILRCFSGAIMVLFALFVGQLTNTFLTFIISSILIFVAVFCSSFPMMKKISAEIFKKVEPRIAHFYAGFSEKTKRRIMKANKQKITQAFYSREELLELLKKSHKILSEDELKWLQTIIWLSDKKVSDIMIGRDKLKVVHQTDLLGPLLIDELHQTTQQYFVVTDKPEQKVYGILPLAKVANLDNKTSQLARNVMDKDFTDVELDMNALESFERMIKAGEDVFIVNNSSGEFEGLLNLDDILLKQEE